MTIISIRQPGYLPYMGYFKKIQVCDIFVDLDDVPYTRSDWDNRNKIRTDKGELILTVPVYNKKDQKLNEVKIVNNQNWSRKHLSSIKLNYIKTPYFKKYWDSIDYILNKKCEKLIDLNLRLIEFIKYELSLKTKTVKSSDLSIESKGSQRLLEICKKLNADTYLSGTLGKNYLDEKLFLDNGIKIIYENFVHPIYRQIHGSFIPNIAIIDVLFNEGDRSKEILAASKNM